MAVTVIIFSLGRITGNPLDVLLPLEAEEEDRIRVEKVWGLDKPITTQYFIFIKNAASGNFGESIKWRGNSAMGLVLDRLPATAILAFDAGHFVSWCLARPALRIRVSMSPTGSVIMVSFPAL